MKKRVIVAAILMVMIMCMAGCGTTTPTLSLDVADEKTAEIVLNKADPEDMVIAGSIEVAEGEILELVPEIEEGSEVKVELVASKEEQSVTEVPEIGEANYEVTMNSNELTTCDVKPGSYMLKVTALTKSNGKISLKVKSAE